MQLIDDIIKAAMGKDSNNKPNSAITISNDMYGVFDESTRRLSSHSSFKAEVNIEKLKDYMMIDLIFPSEVDSDMKVIWHDLETYGDSVQAIEDDTTEIPFLSLTIVPVIYKTSYFLCGVTPFFWCLQPQKPGGPINMIRILFEAEDFNIYESDEINLEEVEAEVNRKIFEMENASLEMERREQEKQEFQEARNRQIAEYKKNNDIY